MREIKFRAWVNDHWVDWIPTCKTLGAYNASIIDTDGYTFEEDNPFIVEQYTGLKDRNGKEIYEGDIVANGTLTGVVEYKVDDFCAWTVGTTTNGIVLLSGSWTVIGNIHENPELLEDEK